MTDFALPIHYGPTEITPEAAGYYAPALERLEAHLGKLIRNDQLLGASYLLSRNGKIFAHRSMGRLCKFEERGELQPDSLRRICSITKIFTAIAVLQLAERGLLYLLQPVCQLIPEFDTPMHREMNLLHLLTHTSGLIADPGYFHEPYPQEHWKTWMQEADWIKGMLRGPCQSKPGEAWSYSSAGYLILGEVISRVSGMHCEEYILQNIARPLGMNETFFDVPAEFRSRVCLTWEWEQEMMQAPADQRTGKPPRNASGLYSTLTDLWKLGELMLHNGTYHGQRLLGRKTVERMISNNLNPNVPAYHWGARYDSYPHGLGWRVIARNLFASPGTFGHEGFGRSFIYIDPTEQFTAVVFVPSHLQYVPESLMPVQEIIWAGID